MLAPPALGGAYGSHCYIAFPADASVRITARSIRPCLRVELRWKLPGKLHRVIGPLAHDVVLNLTFELLISTTMLF